MYHVLKLMVIVDRDDLFVDFVDPDRTDHGWDHFVDDAFDEETILGVGLECALGEGFGLIFGVG